MHVTVYAVICCTMDGCGFTAALCVLLSPTNDRRSYTPDHIFIFYNTLDYYTNATSYSVHAVQYFILVNSGIVRKGALFRILQDPNSAPSRTIQARNHIVRVPIIVRVFGLAHTRTIAGPRLY